MLCLKANCYTFSGGKHTPTEMQGQEQAQAPLQPFLTVFFSGVLSVYITDSLVQLVR